VRALLDVNVCIALLDPSHVFHERAHAWWSKNLKYGWASCPITENGVVRIMANPAYSKETTFSIADLIDRFAAFAAGTDHEFWPDDLSLRNRDLFIGEKLIGSARLTDVYLLAIAAANKGRLATFDRGISITPVRSAKPRNLIHL
jgi:toxin-antitoxin system PIN domain toxin